MNLIQYPEKILWPVTDYLYVEKVGPFQETAPACWKELHQLLPQLDASVKIIGQFSQYKFDPTKMVYRAGAVVTEKPVKLPAGLTHEKFNGGSYIGYVLRGPYSLLPVASGKVFEMFAASKHSRRDDFCLENYVNDPRLTPEQRLVTEILVPVS